MFRLLRLGECLYVLGSVDKLSQETIDRLKLPSEYARAATEVEIAACFAQAGFLEEMYPLIASQKRPEGKVVVDGQMTRPPILGPPEMGESCRMAAGGTREDKKVHGGAGIPDSPGG